MDDIVAMEMGAENLTTAMLSGSLDACACWSPNSLKIMEEMEGATKLADNVMFSDNSVSLASWIVLDGYAAEHGDTSREIRLVKGFSLEKMSSSISQLSQV